MIFNIFNYHCVPNGTPNLLIVCNDPHSVFDRTVRKDSFCSLNTNKVILFVFIAPSDISLPYFLYIHQ